MYLICGVCLRQDISPGGKSFFRGSFPGFVKLSLEVFSCDSQVVSTTCFFLGDGVGPRLSMAEVLRAISVSIFIPSVVNFPASVTNSRWASMNLPNFFVLYRRNPLDGDIVSIRIIVPIRMPDFYSHTWARNQMRTNAGSVSFVFFFILYKHCQTCENCCCYHEIYRLHVSPQSRVFAGGECCWGHCCFASW
jgi:hypothetical protein